MKKAKNCDECRWFAPFMKDPCIKDHKPRFYNPSYFEDQSSWGWKRRCDDFQQKQDNKA